MSDISHEAHEAATSGGGAGISRSVSFMARQQRERESGGGSDTSYDKCFGPPPVWPAARPPGDAAAGGRRSVESTPQTRRKGERVGENGYHPPVPPPTSRGGTRAPMSPEVKRPQPKPRLSLLPQNRQPPTSAVEPHPSKPPVAAKQDSLKDVKDLVADGTDLMRELSVNDDDEDILDRQMAGVASACYPNKKGTRHSIAMTSDESGPPVRLRQKPTVSKTASFNKPTRPYQPADRAIRNGPPIDPSGQRYKHLTQPITILTSAISSQMKIMEMLPCFFCENILLLGIF